MLRITLEILYLNTANIFFLKSATKIVTSVLLKCLPSCLYLIILIYLVHYISIFVFFSITISKYNVNIRQMKVIMGHLHLCCCLLLNNISLNNYRFYFRPFLSATEFSYYRTMQEVFAI